MFQFQLATTFFHELAHVFVTYLGNGRPATPPELNHELYRSMKSGRGESGRFIESKVFSGPLEWTLDPTQDEFQCGIPYVVAENGDATRLGFEVIEKYMNNKEIILPLPLDGQPQLWNSIPKFPYNSAEEEAIGGLNESSTRYAKALQNMKPHQIRLAEVWKVPMDLNIRLKVM